MHLIVWNTEK